MAEDDRPLPDPGVGNHAAADAGRPRRPAVPSLPRALADRRGARGHDDRRRDPRVAGPWLQPPCGEPASRGARGRRARLARGPDRAAGRRAVYGSGDRELRVRTRRASRRREHPPRAGADASDVRPRVRTGALRPRRDDLPRADPPLRRVPTHPRLPLAGTPLRAPTQAVAVRGLLPPAPLERTPRGGRRTRSGRPGSGESLLADGLVERAGGRVVLPETGVRYG